MMILVAKYLGVSVYVCSMNNTRWVCHGVIILETTREHTAFFELLTHSGVFTRRCDEKCVYVCNGVSDKSFVNE